MKPHSMWTKIDQPIYTCSANSVLLSFPLSGILTFGTNNIAIMPMPNSVPAYLLLLFGENVTRNIHTKLETNGERGQFVSNVCMALKSVLS